MNQALSQVRKFRLFLGPRVWSFFILSVLIGLTWFAVEMSFVYVLQIFFRAVGLLQSDQLFLPAWAPTSLEMSLAILVLFAVARSFVQVSKTVLTGLTSQTFIHDQRARLLRESLLGENRFSSNEVISMFSDRVVQAGQFLQASTQLIITGLTGGLLGLGGLIMAPREFLFGVGFFVIFLLPLHRLNRRINGFSSGIGLEWNQITKTLLIGIRNAFLLRLYRRQETEVSRGSLALKRYLDLFYRYYRILAIKTVAPNLVGIFGISIVTVASAWFFHTPPMKLISLFYIFLRIAQSLSEFSANAADFRMYSDSFKLLYRVLGEHQGLHQLKALSPDAYQLGRPVRLEARNLTFSYPNGSKLLENLSFSLQTGQLLLIKGESGVGKSTLVNLLMGLLEPVQGEVLVNQKNVLQLPPEWSYHLGYVGPEPFLLAGTVRENILYPDHDVKLSDEKIWRCLQVAELDGLIQMLPKKLDEPLHEQTQFSTGQKQRLAFARALARNPSILILDEATANIDHETESRILVSLENLKRDLLIIVVSHRSTFDRLADFTIQLHKKGGAHAHGSQKTLTSPV